MSAAAPLPAAILATVLDRLAPLFLTGANNDAPTARDAARQILIAYDPRTDDELRLAAEIISFSFHALEALSQAKGPALSLNQILRLRGSAVSLSREAHKSQRKLDQLQKARRATKPAQPQPHPESTPHPVRPRTDDAVAPVETARPFSGETAGQTWSQAYQKRQTAKRITENLRKNQSVLLCQPTVPTPAQ